MTSRLVTECGVVIGDSHGVTQQKRAARQNVSRPVLDLITQAPMFYAARTLNLTASTEAHEAEAEQRQNQ